MKILLIEDDPHVTEAILLSLRMGFPQASLYSSHLGGKGIEMVESESPDVILLDLSLPDIDGFDVLCDIRDFSDVPVIIVSVRGDEMDRVRGLELGADDYVVKPFSSMELLARTRAVLRRRRTNGSAAPTTLDCGKLVINPTSQEVRLRGEEIRLTPIEYRLLCQLAKCNGQIVSQKTLIENIWGDEYLDTPKVLKVHIHRLRQKLKDNCDSPQIITTVCGRGYKLRAAS